MLSMFKNEVDFWVAESLDEARAVAAIYYDSQLYDPSERAELVEGLRQASPDRTLSVVCNQHGEPDDVGELVKKTAAEWATQLGKSNAPAFSLER